MVDALVVCRFVPETRGLTVEQVQAAFAAADRFKRSSLLRDLRPRLSDRSCLGGEGKGEMWMGKKGGWVGGGLM